MIDITREQVFSLTEAARRLPLPRRRKGAKPHVSTLYRWAQRGCRGVRLEAIQCGGTLCTSAEALQRFFDRLSEPTGKTAPPTPSDCRSAVARARAELDEAGI